jgi:hypothetical protein
MASLMYLSLFCRVGTPGVPSSTGLYLLNETTVMKRDMKHVWMISLSCLMITGNVTRPQYPSIQYPAPHHDLPRQPRLVIPKDSHQQPPHIERPVNHGGRRRTAKVLHYV